MKKRYDKPISKLYWILDSMTKDNTHHIKEKWDRESKEIDEEAWLKICTQAHIVINASSWKDSSRYHKLWQK